MKRRKALKWTAIGAGGVGALAVGGGGALAYFWSNVKVDTVGKVDFDTPLAIPPEAESETDSAGSRVFNLDIRASRTQFKPGPATETWGVNQDYLGPTIRARRGEEVAFAISNGLDEETSVHWHGMHLPAVMDGGPHQAIAPGEVWAPQWTLDQPATTLWYHPHPHGETARHVLNGVSGLFIIDDDRTDELNLPRTYGVDDVPMIVQDRKFDDAGQFEATGTFMGSQGWMGDEILVNGTLGPYHEVSTRLVRLRILNGSNSRLYNFGFSDDRSFSLIGTDGGLLPEAWETDRIQISPGERAEIVVAFEPGETVELRSYEADFDYFGPFSRVNGGDDRFDVCQFRAADSLADDTEIPSAMGSAPDVDGDEVAEERSFTLSGMSNINGESMDMQRIDFGVRVGTTEVWEVKSNDAYLHSFHVHDVQYQVLSVDGEEPPPFLRGWKDTVFLQPQRRYRLAMRFDDYTDPNLPYMYHCHILVHEDRGMMGQFVVLGEDEEIGTVPENSTVHDHS
ncbi:multicopper oxidase domain-containing protein [Glycomyces albus]